MPGTAFGECEGYLLICHTDANPTPEEWAGYLQHVRDRVGVLRGVLAVTAGGAPNSRQRKDLAHLLDMRDAPKVPIAVVTASPIARGAITALAWLGISDIKPFAPAQVNDALDFLGVDSDRQHLVIAELARLRGRIDQRPAKTG